MDIQTSYYPFVFSSINTPCMEVQLFQNFGFYTYLHYKEEPRNYFALYNKPRQSVNLFGQEFIKNC